MTTADTSITLSETSRSALLEYARSTNYLMSSTWSIRPKLEEIDRYYIREGDLTLEQQRAKLANRLGDKTRMQNMQVPVIMPQIESALTYQVNVFLTGYPIFGVGAPPQSANAALQMETIIGENSITAGWAEQFILFFRDGLKYNLCGAEVVWDRKTTYSVETDLNYSAKVGKPTEVIWEGNCVKRIDMYNVVFDTRVHPSEVHKRGDFAGYIDVMTRMELKSYINNLYGKIPASVAIKAFESGAVAPILGSGDYWMSYYIPEVNPDALLNKQQRGTFNWMQWATASAKSGIQYRDVYEVFTLYCRILPVDFSLRVKAENTPQIWKLVIVNRQVVLYAEQLSNAHNYLPMLICQPFADGLDFQTKSMAQNAMPFQDMATANWAADIASKRRLVTDRVLYDPSRIREVDINSDNPSAKIPIRPSAYGKPVADAVHQFPFRDEQAGTLIQQANMIVQNADRANGQNPAAQGQFVKGNKTLHEYQDIMGHSNSRNQLIAMMFEHQMLTPMKEMIKLNILQYQAPGDKYNQATQSQVKIDPSELRKAAMAFKISDGLTPKDKLMSADTMQVALQVMGSSPQIQSEYSIAPLFSYLMKQQGADLAPFEKDPVAMQYQSALQQWTGAAMELAKSKPAISPEELQKVIELIIGPKPQPPKTPQQQQQEQANNPQATTQQVAAAAGQPAA